MIVPAVGQRRDRAGVGHPCAAGRSGAEAPLRRPPLIAPLLVSVAIVPVLETPAPPAAGRGQTPPPPPMMAPLLVSVAIVPELDTPAPPAAAPLSADAAAAGDRAAVGQRRDRAGVGHAGAAGRVAGEGRAPAPPVIAPRLVSVLIVPALDNPGAASRFAFETLTLPP